MAREKLSRIVSRQLPEFVREDYPTFVAFVEAYYEYMQTQGVDFDKVRDIDTTLDEFVEYFRKQLAVNLPPVIVDERYLLQHIKDQYLSKGSEGSFKLLFRLLYGKNVELSYPGQQMLIASDGKWNQEISVFVDVDYGDPNDVVGRLVDISSGDRVLSVLIDRKEELVGEVDRIVALGGNKYEMYLDKRFFGELQPGDKIRYKDEFQGTILPATTLLTIGQGGKNFRIGQVFSLNSGGGTGALMKVTKTGEFGAIEAAEIIKFGIGYNADFAVSLIAENSVTARTVQDPSTSTRVGNNLTLGDRTLGFEEQGYINNANVYDVSSGEGAVYSITVTNGGSGYSTASASIAASPESDGIDATVASVSINSDGEIESITVDVKGSGYDPSSPPTVTITGDGSSATATANVSVDGGYIDATYAGTIVREFALYAGNTSDEADVPAIIEITLGALNRYPGYFETNNGFLSDSIYIQDSRYYQKFSYVLRIDERLSDYKSAIKTMLHPAGMKLFGEFDITNDFDLSLTLESLVKSLGLGLEDDVAVEHTSLIYDMIKPLTDSLTIDDSSVGISYQLSATLTAESVTEADELTHLTTKALSDSASVVTSSTDIQKILGLSLSDSTPTMTHDLTFDVETALADTQTIAEDLDQAVTKYLTDSSVGTLTESGEIFLNPYAAQDYFAETYETGAVQTF
jgi:hypothetical protein